MPSGLGGYRIQRGDPGGMRTLHRGLVTRPLGLDFLEFMETSEVVGPGPNPREIDISFGAEGPLACARPDPTIGWTDVLPCVFVCVGRR